MKLEPAEWTACLAALLEIIDPQQDSIRTYHLGNNWAERIEHYGVRNDVDIDGFLNV